MEKLYTINLYGYLADEFGSEPVKVYAKSVKDAFTNLTYRFGRKFKDTILNGSWYLTTDNYGTKVDTPPKDSNFLAPEEVELSLEEETINVFPAITGSGGGWGRIILGVVLIIVAVVIIVFTGGAGAAAVGGAAGSGAAGGAAAGGIGGALAAAAPAIAAAGVVSIAGGIMQLLTPPPSLGDYSSASVGRKQSFLYNGAVNNIEQGVPVPLVYGEHKTGSTIISGGLDVAQLAQD